MRGTALAAILITLAALEAGYRSYFHLRRLLRPADDAFTVYAVGESTMTGYPYAASFSLPSLVFERLGRTIDGRPVRVVSVAQSGESVYPQAVALEHALRVRSSGPGLVLIYSGNNDVGRPGAPSRLEDLREAVLDRSMLLRDLWYLGERGGPLPRRRDLGTYEFWLRRVVRESRSAGLVPVLSTVVSNAGDMDPGVSSACDLPRSDVDAALREGEAAEARGDYGAAADAYERARRADRVAPYLDFKIGKCRERLGDFDGARASFKKALDAPSCNLFLRATSLQNGFIRELARDERVPLVDAERVFEARSPHGILGDSLFSDGQHPNLDGYALLAGAFAQAVSRDLGLPAPASVAAPRLRAKDQARADVISGSWLLTVSITHFRPAARLSRARGYFERAARLDPSSFRAWLGLGLTQAALRGFLERQENLDFLAAHHLYYGDLGARLRRADLPEIARRLKDGGASPAAIEKMLAASQNDPELL